MAQERKSNNNNNTNTMLKRWNNQQTNKINPLYLLDDDDTKSLSTRGYKINCFIASSLQGTIYGATKKSKHNNYNNNHQRNKFEFVIKTCNKKLSSTSKGLQIKIDKKTQKERVVMVDVNEKILREIAIMKKLQTKKNHSCVFSCNYLDMFNMFMCASGCTIVRYYLFLFVYNIVFI